MLWLPPFGCLFFFLLLFLPSNSPSFYLVFRLWWDTNLCPRTFAQIVSPRRSPLDQVSISSTFTRTFFVRILVPKPKRSQKSCQKGHSYEKSVRKNVDEIDGRGLPPKLDCLILLKNIFGEVIQPSVSQPVGHGAFFVGRQTFLVLF